MASGYKSGGVDFDDLFDPDIMGDGPTAAGYRSGGVLLKYAALVYGTKRANVGYRVGGVDVSNLWAAKGTAVYLTDVNSNTLRLDGAAATASITVTASTDGRIIFVADNGGTVNYYTPTTAGIGSGYQVRATGPVGGTLSGAPNTATLTGKGGVSFSAVSTPGNSGTYDTGWQEMDAANPLLTMQSYSAPRNGTANVSGTMNIQVRRKSDSEIVRTFGITFDCTSDSQN